LDLGREPQADATFREALQSNPKMGAAYNALGALAYQRGRLDEAERLIRQGLALEPDVRTGRFNLARILEDRGKRAEAEALYTEELEVYPDHGRSHFNLAQIARVGGDREGYLSGLRRCIDQAAQFGPCYFYLSREELGAGRLESAADLARRGLESDPHSPVAPLGHYVLADVYNRQGQPARAREELARARRIELSLQKAPQPRPLD
jgi:tetratricopeptide (TPR) repeat protein